MTLDSASNNNTAMEELEELFIQELADLLNSEPNTVLFDADGNRIR